MATEYATTVGEYRTAGRYDSDYRDARADNPALPEGDGWRFVGAAAADGVLFWFWERDTPDRAPEAK